MLIKLIKYLIIIMVIFAPSTISGATPFRIINIHPSSVNVTYNFLNSTKEQIFAVTTLQDVAVSVSELSSNAIITKLGSGTVAKEYLQWFSITFQKEIDAKINRTGKLLITFSKPVLKQTRLSTSISNMIIHLPLLHTSKRNSLHSQPPTLPYSVGVRIEVVEDGIFAISGLELENIGVPIASILQQTYRLFCKEKEIPIHFTNSDSKYLKNEDHILFYGEHLRGTFGHYAQFSYGNVYWLTWAKSSPGLRITTVSGKQTTDPTSYATETSIKMISFKDTMHHEIDNDIRWIGDINSISEAENQTSISDTIDNWYWGIIGDKKSTNFTFSIPAPRLNAGNDFSIQISLVGMTSIPDIANDHRYAISINDYELNTDVAIWDGQKNYLFTSSGNSNNILKHGENFITLTRTLDASIPDRVALNWIKLTYEKQFTALNNYIEFSHSNTRTGKLNQFTINGFSSNKIEIWDIDAQRFFRSFQVSMKQGSYQLTFQDSVSTKNRYIAQSITKRKTPFTISLDTIITPLTKNNVEYIIISNNIFLPLCKPLEDFHSENGLTVASVDIQDVYNSYTYGIHDPEAIKLFIKDLYENQSSKPRYLLLAGDGSHDLDKKNRGKNIIPTHLNTVPNWGPSSNDGYFTTISGSDNFPDIPVGRLPAETIEEMNIIISKTVNYLKNPEHGYWRDNIIIAGGYENNFTFFNNETVSDIIGPRMHVLRMDADPNSPFYVSGTNAATQMADYINSGAYILNFVGHGGGNVWSDSKFFSYSDLSKLHNSQWGTGGRLPIIFSFTCLTGFFESVFYSSLGEEFIRDSKNGAICFFGASGYTRREIDIDMSRTILNFSMNGKYESLGELILHVECAMLAKYGSEAVPLIRQYNLLGDPAIPFRLVPDSSIVTLNTQTPSGSDTLIVNGSSPTIHGGNIKIETIADYITPWSNKIITTTDSIFTAKIPLKKESITAKGLVRTLFWDDTKTHLGWVWFSKDTFAIHDVAITPAEPSLGDTVYVTFHLDKKHINSIGTIQCRYTIDNPINPNQISFNDKNYVFMSYDSLDGLWHSQHGIPVGAISDNFSFSDMFIIKFVDTGILGETNCFNFPIKGRSDITFTENKPKVIWSNDSFAICFEVINKGNISAVRFHCMATTNSITANDTMEWEISPDSLKSGKTILIQKSLAFKPSGRRTLTLHLDSKDKNSEFCEKNNATDIDLSITTASLINITDTLSSSGRGLIISPASKLSKKVTGYLIGDSIVSIKPLATASSWINLINDGHFAYTLYTSPSLSSVDSLLWCFTPDTLSTLTNKNAQQHSIFYLDTVNNVWRSSNPSVSIENSIIAMLPSETKYAAGRFADTLPPEIRIFVSGKEIIYLDYTAQEKPFNIILTDSSGIIPSSISVTLNGQPLKADKISTTFENSNKTNIALTAYPAKINKIDTLSVTAKDNAGNTATSNFSYRPGEKLTIRYLSCHPNPFSAKFGSTIRFAFMLTDLADKVSLTIYTISGRKVWQWKSNTSLIGYQEIAWDGSTTNLRYNPHISPTNRGHRIANGTYYAKLVAKNNSGNVEKIIRIAKLEGY